MIGLRAIEGGLETGLLSVGLPSRDDMGEVLPALSLALISVWALNIALKHTSIFFILDL